MQAIVSSSEGAQLRDVPAPVPGPGEILVQVRAASLNRADLAALGAKDGIAFEDATVLIMALERVRSNAHFGKIVLSL